MWQSWRMQDFDPKEYGRIWARHYDDIFDSEPDESIIDCLTDLAGQPPRALELAIGSGRVALPLSRKGVRVTGIDISQEMIDLMVAKDGADAIETIIGDFADVPVGDDTFPLVFIAFNTLFILPDQDRQLACFHNVERALESEGRFVVEAFVPDLTRFDQFNTRLGVSSIKSAQSHTIEMSIHDPVGQTTLSHQIHRLETGETVVLPVRVRYCWPSEIDLMAKMAGLELEARWGWYDRRPFTEQSKQHVSVYKKP